ncbi:hypothetical protein HFP72_13665 [Nocardiopsis sp. ARC36]
MPLDPTAAREHVAAVREAVPDHVSIGVSGDGAAATGLNAGCRTWFSVLGGTVPNTVLPLVKAALNGDSEAAVAESDRLRPLWEMFAAHGSLRVTAAIAEHLELVPRTACRVRSWASPPPSGSRWPAWSRNCAWPEPHGHVHRVGTGPLPPEDEGRAPRTRGAESGSGRGPGQKTGPAVPSGSAAWHSAQSQ